jgi:gamma-glutamylputrescine oxidase
MANDSYYQAKAPPVAPRPTLAGAIETEIAIVGGGLAGLATALSLSERGHCAVLLESGTIGSGASGRNGGMVSAGFAASTRLMERAVGRHPASTLMRLSREAMGLMRERIARYAIACEPVSGVVIASWFDDAKALAADVAEYNARYGMRLEFWPRDRLQRDFPSPRYWDGMFDPEGYHLDPLALCRGYAAAAESQGARLFEHSPATALRRVGGRWQVSTPQGDITTERLVLCQSAYPPRLLPALARATLPVFTYIIVTAPLAGAKAEVIRAPYAVYDNRFATGYHRLLPDGRLLWGGRISTQEHPKDLAGLMRRDLALVYPQLADVPVDYAWSGRMGFARHKMPLIRELAPGLWVNSCFGGHGLNTTTLGGEFVASALVEGDRRWKLLAPFAPRWTGGALGPLAAQAIYGRARLQDAARSYWHRRRARRRQAGL